MKLLSLLPLAVVLTPAGIVLWQAWSARMSAEYRSLPPRRIPVPLPRRGR